MHASIDNLRSFYGDGERTSDWVTVDQPTINQFGESTFDSDWIHTDPDRARKESPFGTTIAMGFWTVSLLTHFSRITSGRDYPEGALYGLNYGIDRLRLMAPIRVGKRIRNHSRLIDIEDRGAGRYLVKTENRVEIEGEQKPAMIAVWLFMVVFPDSSLQA